MPPGLAAVIVQTALFTIVFAAAGLGERPTAAQSSGAALALA